MRRKCVALIRAGVAEGVGPIRSSGLVKMRRVDVDSPVKAWRRNDYSRYPCIRGYGHRPPRLLMKVVLVLLLNQVPTEADLGGKTA